MKLIVALCKNRGIGKDNELPWNIRSDLIKFSKLTRGSGNNAIIMGKNTWLSLPKRPLPKRDNLILSSSLKLEDLKRDFLSTNFGEFPENIKIFKNVEDLLEFCREKYDDIWVIGGASIYREFLDRNLVKEMYISYIDKDFDCDVFFPEINEVDWIVETSELPLKEGEEYEFAIYDKKYIRKRLSVKDILERENMMVEKPIE
jgi:dihydrofolate reductase